MAELSTKPYLIRAIHQWCEDSGYRPYLAVMVDERTQVPREFVRNGEIVLNVSAVATNRLQIGQELIEFEARFSGAVRQVSIPIENVSAIYAQETGHGMAFDVPKPLALAPDRGASEPDSRPPPAGAGTPRLASRPKLVPRPEQPESPVAGPAPAAEAPPPLLQAVESAPPASGRTSRASASKPRRRGKLAAVPDGASGASESAVPSDRPEVDSTAAKTPRAVPENASPGATDRASSTPPAASPGSGTAPDEPPPTPPVRPQLKRIK